MEIKEIYMDKYIVLKKEDIKKYLNAKQEIELSKINTEIRFGRIKDKKTEWNNYLVLNMDDEFDRDSLLESLINHLDDFPGNPNIKDIAVDLVNAILKTQK